MIRLFLTALLLSLPTALALGQTKTPEAAEAWQAVFFASPAKALPLLTAAAISHSPELRALEIDKSLDELNLKLSRRAILNSAALGAGYAYGNQASIALNDPLNPNQFTTFSSGRYQIGASFNLPLGQVASRGTQIRKEELNYKRSEATRQSQESQLRQQIIQLYQNVLLARKVFTLQQEALVNTRTNYQLAEKKFQQGQINLQELSEVSALLTSVSVARESAKSQYDTAFLVLEEVVGEKIPTLMTSTL